VVQVNVTNENDREEAVDEKLRKETEEFTEKSPLVEDYENKDAPLEKMTKKKLLEKIKDLQQSAENNFDLYVRSQAEIDNLKKRFQKEKNELIKFSNEGLIKQLLPVADNLGNALSHSEEEESLDALREGMQLTLKCLMDTLEKTGVKQVRAMDKLFDPTFHEAVSEQVDDTVEAGTVLQELQKGYVLNERLIRPAMVVVSKRVA